MQPQKDEMGQKDPYTLSPPLRPPHSFYLFSFLEKNKKSEEDKVEEKGERIVEDGRNRDKYLIMTRERELVGRCK